MFLALTAFSQLSAQRNYSADFYIKFSKYYATGDFINAERCLLNSLESKDYQTTENLIVIYNNLGVLSALLGKYDEALIYFNIAEIEVENKHQPTSEFANIYINKARIYGILRESDKAIGYLEQGIKIYLSLKKTDQQILFRISTAYLNLGLTYFEKKDYNSALLYLEKSIELKLKNNLSETALPYLNLAKTYAKISKPVKAQQYFLMSIANFNREFGQDYYRLAEVYFDYGFFLRSIGKNQDALIIHQKALSICLKNYGEKHTLVSLTYMLLGDDYLNQSDYSTALQYYQKSLIAVVNGFNDTDIYSNPALNSVIFDIRLLENLKRKAQVLELFSQLPENREKRQQIMGKSFETIELALQLIGRIRSGYVSTESRIYLAENEKETYIFAAHVAQQLFELTKEERYRQRMYSIACISKSAVLRNEIAENELLYRRSNPDSLTDKHNQLLINIDSYSKLIQDELRRIKPDSLKIDFWKNSLFELNRGKEQLEERIKALYPQYEALIHKTEPINLKAIQDHLRSDETLVEYFLSNSYTEGKRSLYIFTITQSKLDYRVTGLDSLFVGYVKSIKWGSVNAQALGKPIVPFQSYTDALYYMYEKLIKPVEANLAGRKLIIVPDEEIAYLPFDAFIRQRPDSNQFSYEDLQYLIYDYTVSYGYTSSLIFKKGDGRAISKKVYSFSPDYGNHQKGLGEGLNTLKGTGKEITSISRWFKGDAYYGREATESNFKRLLSQPAIFHLAMHSQTDSSNSKYSYLIFDTQSDSVNDGRLFNYEISMSSVESPMVVLSACNTATGNLYQGEGVMSLTRGFILAGASSVINTFWDVNDDTSSKIMIDFYHYLSKGDEKDEALRKAKLNYLKNTPPTYANPYYWAAYEVMGDKSPVKRSRVLLLSVGLFLVLASVSFVGIRTFMARRG